MKRNNKRRKNAIPWISLTLILLGIIYNFETAFYFKFSELYVFLLCFILSGTVTFMVIKVREKYSFYSFGMVCTGMIVCFLNRKNDFISGFRCVVNHIMKRRNHYFEKSVVDIAKSRKEIANGTILLLFFLLFLVTILICILLYRFYYKVYAFFLAGIVMGIGLVLGSAPGTKACFCYLAGIMLACVWIEQEKSSNYMKNQNEQNIWKDRNRMYSIVFGMILLAAFSGYLLSHATQKKVMIRSEKYMHFQHKMEADMMQNVKSMISKVNSYLGFDSDGILENVSPKYTNDVVMEITVKEKPEQPLYLHGYTGERYTNGRWEKLPEVKTKSDLFSEKNQIEIYNLNSDFAEHISNYEDTLRRKNEYKVIYKGKGKRSKYAYIPYFSNMRNEVFNENKSLFRFDDEKGLQKRSDEIRITYSEMQIEQIEDYYEDIIFNPLFCMSDVQQKYWIFVQDNYLYVPAKFKRLDKLINENLGDEDGNNPFHLAECIKIILKSQASYSTNLHSVSVGNDYVEDFLFNQHKGFCEHFATAGTLLLRKCGIPARYASGYKVDINQFKKNRDGTYTARVLDADAHAWSEIFVKDIGWVPEEMTPSSSDTSANYSETSSMDKDQKDEKKKTTKEEKKGDSTQETKQTSTPKTKRSSVPKTEQSSVPKKSTQENRKRKIKISSKEENQGIKIVLLITLLIILCYLLFIVRKRKMQRKISHLDNNNKVVLISFQWMLHLLEKMNYCKMMEKTEDEIFDTLLEKNKEIISIQDYTEWMQIYQKASYSNRQITRQEWQIYYKILKKILEKGYQNSNIIIKCFLNLSIEQKYLYKFFENYGRQ